MAEDQPTPSRPAQRLPRPFNDIACELAVAETRYAQAHAAVDSAMRAVSKAANDIRRLQAEFDLAVEETRAGALGWTPWGQERLQKDPAADFDGGTDNGE